ncbi:MAG: family 20 glycosylhydrolase [Cellulophaga sp.]
MKKILSLLLFAIFCFNVSVSQSIFQVKGLCIAAPAVDRVDEFTEFISDELAPAGINTLILRVDFNYAYESRPELRDKNPLTKADVKKLVAVCKKHNINLIPQVNLLGHQTWAAKTNKLLEVYPEFDETPRVKMPEKYEWPNADGLYCKSYCPRHPEVHKVVFDLVDEIMEVFEATDFHAGMDEVFYIADAECPRCKGVSPAKIFAEEVSKISRHLEKSNARLWIWGDRLIDASNSGIGMWEASMNNTHTALNSIPKSVVICDWHYEKAIPTPVYFAMNGFDVIACPWRKPDVAVAQVEMMHNFKKNATPEMKEHFQGVMHTVWSPAGRFLDAYKNYKTSDYKKGNQVACFKAMVEAIAEIEKQQAK